MSRYRYPPSPSTVPDGLTDPSARYRLQVAVMFVSIGAFIVFYLALCGASAWLLWQAISYSVGRIGFWTVVIKLGLVAMPAMLFIFLVKPLLKVKRLDRTALFEVDPKQEPDLFAFIAKLCAETGAPLPLRVYLTHEVNAAVFYDSSILSLFLPVRKNLLIGLGLVSELNLSELKAVLAHEFGHFSQRTMTLGSYVYIAQQLVSEIVHGRDGWDDILHGWRRQDIRIAVFGWLLYGIVWVVRKVLGLAFKGIALIHAGLSRQMEFQADRVAVRVAGSDAIVNALCRASFADQCMAQTLRDLTHAGDHGLYTRDLFAHLPKSAEFLRRLERKPDLGVPPALPRDPRATAVVFGEGAGVTPSMWSSHPPNDEREQSAKALYVRSAIDERPAWLLFRDAKRLREDLTRRLMARPGAPPPKLVEPETVQRFIDDEHEETTFDARYHDMYEGRPIALGDADLHALEEEAERGARAPATLASEHAALWGDGLAELMAGVKSLEKERGRLQAAARGGLGVRAQFRGREVSRGDAERLLDDVGVELGAKRKLLAARDRLVYRVHYRMALDLHARGGELAAAHHELHERYEFHALLQQTADELGRGRAELEAALSIVSGGGELSQDEVLNFFGALSGARQQLVSALWRARNAGIPTLRNLGEGTKLGAFLLAGAVVSDAPLSARSVDGHWIGSLCGQFDEALDKARRLHFKSVGGILGLQERVEQAWQKPLSDEGAPPADDQGPAPSSSATGSSCST